MVKDKKEWRRLCSVVRARTKADRDRYFNRLADEAEDGLKIELVRYERLLLMMEWYVGLRGPGVYFQDGPLQSHVESYIITASVTKFRHYNYLSLRFLNLLIPFLLIFTLLIFNL